MSSTKIVITDTSCFILLSKIDAFELLQRLFGTVLTTPEIAREFGEQLPEWVTVVPVINQDLFQLYKEEVDPGEASALALAKELLADLVILDDMNARRFAGKIGITFKGTLGLFLMAKQAKLIPAVKPYIEKIKQTNFWIAAHLLEQCIRDAGE